MGADGGSNPKRDELVKTKGKTERADPAALLAASWLFCALSKEPLRKPVVSCEFGKLYNRESIIQHLLDKSKFGDAQSICPHITSLKDVTTLQLTPNPDYREENVSGPVVATKGASLTTAVQSPFVCPVSGREMSGRHPFVYVKGCGHVLTSAAMREVNATSCPVCSQPLQSDPEDKTGVVPINPSPEIVERLKAQSAARMARRLQEKEAKKASKGGKADRSSSGSRKRKAEREHAESSIGPLAPVDKKLKKQRTVTDGLGA